MARTWQKVRPLAKLTVLENTVVGGLLRTKLGRASARDRLRAAPGGGLEKRAGSWRAGCHRRAEEAGAGAGDGHKARMILLDEVMAA